MIQRVYEQVKKSKAVSDVIVATDDDRIATEVDKFGGKYQLTSKEHKTGTDRCIEVMESLRLDENFDLVINVQGDEPFIQTEQLDSLIELFMDSSVEIGTLKKALNDDRDILDANTVKVVTDTRNKALYFSRSPIPFGRGLEEGQWNSKGLHYKHIGIYGFRPNVLLRIKEMDSSPMEEMESLEQLRWLDNGCTIAVGETNFQSPSIDTEADLDFVEKFLKKHPEFL